MPQAGSAQSTARSITAAQVAERIRANVGAAWREKTIDGFKAGSPETAVTGIVTTVMATRRVLARAVERGRNLVVTQEPVFYNANDEPGNRASDAIYLAKKAYIEQHGLVVFRFADHWNSRQPDPRVAALARALSWEGPGTNGVFAIRETSLSSLAAHLRERLADSRRVAHARCPGHAGPLGAADSRHDRCADCDGRTEGRRRCRRRRASRVGSRAPVRCSTDPQWREAGANKALLAIGRVVSEEPGMKACAEWLETFIPEVPVEAIPVGDPYWSPLA